jgi:hypothetical protein
MRSGYLADGDVDEDGRFAMLDESFDALDDGDEGEGGEWGLTADDLLNELLHRSYEVVVHTRDQEGMSTKDGEGEEGERDGSGANEESTIKKDLESTARAAATSVVAATGVHTQSAGEKEAEHGRLSVTRSYAEGREATPSSDAFLCGGITFLPNPEILKLGWQGDTSAVIKTVPTDQLTYEKIYLEVA